MRAITADPSLVAHCGLYCGACRAYLKGRCPGCHENAKASWCKIRSCCIEHAYPTCAECLDFSDPNDCRRFNTLVSKVIGVVLNSDRKACVLSIRERGEAGFAAHMAERGRQTLPRR